MILFKCNPVSLCNCIHIHISPYTYIQNSEFSSSGDFACRDVPGFSTGDTNITMTCSSCAPWWLPTDPLGLRGTQFCSHSILWFIGQSSVTCGVAKCGYKWSVHSHPASMKKWLSSLVKSAPLFNNTPTAHSGKFMKETMQRKGRKGDPPAPQLLTKEGLKMCERGTDNKRLRAWERNWSLRADNQYLGWCLCYSHWVTVVHLISMSAPLNQAAFKGTVL